MISVNNLSTLRELCYPSSISTNCSPLSQNKVLTRIAKPYLFPKEPIRNLGFIHISSLSTECPSSQFPTETKPSQGSLASLKTKINYEEREMSTTPQEFNDDIYRLPSQNLSPISTINELGEEMSSKRSKTEVTGVTKQNFDRNEALASLCGDSLNEAKSLQNPRIKPIPLLKSFVEAPLGLQKSRDKGNIKKSMFCKTEQDSSFVLSSSINQNSEPTVRTKSYNVKVQNFGSPVIGLQGHMEDIKSAMSSPNAKPTQVRDISRVNKTKFIIKSRLNNSEMRSPTAKSPENYQQTLFKKDNKSFKAVVVLNPKKGGVILLKSPKGNEKEDGNLVRTSVAFYRPKGQEKYDSNVYLRRLD